MRAIPARLWVLGALSAVLQVLAFPVVGPVPPMARLTCWVCLVPLLLALRGSTHEKKGLSPFQGALLAYGCGVLWYLGNCYWIYQTMYLYGGLPKPAALGILVLFSLYLGLYHAGFGAGFVFLQRRLGSGWALALSPFLWVAVELARARITGFPWDLLGYTQVDNSLLVPLATLTGVMGLSLVVAAGNALWLWRPAKHQQFAGRVLALCLMGLQVAGSLHRSPAAAAGETAVLLQDNLEVGAQAQGPRESEAAMLRSFAALTAHPQQAPGTSGIAPALVTWPEAPTSFEDADPALREAVGEVARSEKAPIVVDSVGRNPGEAGTEYVSASFYLPDGTYAGRYDKMHLVPFGEYTPYKQMFFFAGHLLDGLNFVPGTRRRLFSVNGHRYGVFICYESIFGDEIRQFTKNGAEVLVNLSDDGWYGDTSAPWEHLDMARMRAIENGRWLLRDTNTGLTASIDPQGRIIAALPRHVRDAIVVPFGYRQGTTLYTRAGDWIAWTCCAIVLAALVDGELRRRQRTVN